MINIIIRIGGYAMGIRIRELRKERVMNQDTLASFMGVSQQTISKIERNVEAISMDLLVRFAEYFNVTTDYILGISEEKRNLRQQNKINSRLEEHYDLVIEYEELNENNQKLLKAIMRTLREMQKKEIK